MIRQVWFIAANAIEHFRENWPLRQLERQDPRVLEGEHLLEALGQKVTRPRPVITAAEENR